METVKYITYPRKFGQMLVPPELTTLAMDGWEVDVLEALRDHFWEKDGEVLSWKKDLKPVEGEFDRLRSALRNLWRAGIVLKFSKSFHTQSGRPQYIQWYIWEDE